MGPVPHDPGRPEQVSSRAELAVALTAIRERAGLSIRELARRIDARSGTLGDYFGGRHLPSTGQLPVLGRALRACGLDEDEVAAWLAAARRVRARTAPPPTGSARERPAPPYPGLASFQLQDAALFFGRDSETAQIVTLLDRLHADPGPSGGLLTVIGPSGSGKSSLLRAGVMAAVDGRTAGTPAAGTPPGDVPWSGVLLTPGRDPLGALRHALAGTSAAGVLVLVVDQFEEVFTSPDDPADSDRFVDALADLGRAGTLVVLGMRADFYARATRNPVLLGALRHAQIVVGPMSADSLRAAVVGPAQAVGAEVEDGLVELVLAEVAPRRGTAEAHDVGALPLLSHALLSTWERGDGTRLTRADYRATGGIDAAVQATAEAVFAGLDEQQRTIARRLFLRLVNLDDDVAGTRRRVSRDELASLESGPDHRVAEVVDRFVARRLLTAGAETVEVSHEALLSAWPRLRDWIDDDRAGLRVHRQVTDAANVWDAAGRDDGLLLRGGRLQAALDWGDDAATELSRLEREYLRAGADAAAAARRRARRRVRRLRQLLTAVGVLALVAVGLAVYSARARTDADNARLDATTARDDALSRQVAFQSRDLVSSDPALAQQLAVVALRTASTGEARSALIDQSTRPVVTRVLGAQGPTALALSRDGRVAAVGHADDGTVHLYAVRPGAIPVVLGVLPGDGSSAHQVYALAFTPDGRYLAEGGQSPRVRVFDVADPRRPRLAATLLPGFTGAVQTLAVAPDGSALAAGSAGPHPVLEWSLRDPAHPVPLPPPPGTPAGLTVQSIAFGPDGRLLVAGGSQGTLLVWRAGATRPARALAPGGNTVDAVLVAGDGRTIYAADRSGAVRVFTQGATGPVASGALSGTSASQANALALTPDGHTLAVGSSDDTVRQFDVATRSMIASTGNPGPVTGAAYSATTLLTTATDGTLRLQGITRSVTVDGNAFGVSYPARGSLLLVAVSGDHSGVRLWNTADPARPVPAGPPIPSPPGPRSAVGAISADGHEVATGNGAGDVALWDTTAAAHPRELGRPFAAATGLIEGLSFSPDRHLLAVADDDRAVHLWDVGDPGRPRRLATMGGHDLMLSVAFSPDGRLVAGANADGHAYVWRVATPATPVATLGGFANYVYGVAFSPDGRTVAVTSSDHTSRLWDVRDPAHARVLGRPLIGPTDYVYAAAFSPDGRTVAVASNDRTVRLYDARHPGSGVPVVTLTAGSPLFALAFSPDGRYLVAGGSAPMLPEWTTDVDAYVRRLCPLVGDPITRREWSLYVPGARYDPPCR